MVSASAEEDIVTENPTLNTDSGMDIQEKTKEELIKELQELQQENYSLKELLDGEITICNNSDDVIRETNLKLALAMQGGNMAWWEMEVPAGNVTFDKHKVEMLGYAPENFKHYTDFTNLVHPNDYKRIMNAMKGHLEGALDKYEAEYRIMASSGEYIWFNDFGSVVKKDPDGKPLIVSGFVFNISERKNAEKRQLKIMKALDSASDAIAISDAQGRHIYQNKALSDLFGYETVEDIEAAGGRMARVKDPAIAKQLSGTILNGKSWSCELEMVTKSGRIFPAYERADEIKDNEGNTIGIIGIITDITERKKNEEALLKSEHLLSSIYDSVGDLLFLLKVEADECYRFISVNKAYCKVTGLSEEMVVGKLMSEVIPEHSLSIVKEKHRQAIKESSAIRWEDTFDYPNGQLVGDISICPIFDEKGFCTHLVGSVHDITEKQEFEKKILRDKKLADQLINSLPGLFYQIDGDGKFVNWNKNLETVSGYSPTELSEMTALDFFAGEDKLNIEKNIIQVFTVGNASMEATLISKNQTKTPYYFTGKKITIDDQIYLSGFGIDISTKKKDEEILLKSEERFRTIFESSTIGIYRTTPDGQILLANPALIELLGYSSFEELAGRDLEEDGFEPNFERTYFRDVLKRDGEVKALETAWTKRNGTTLFISESARAINDQEGNVIYYDGIVEDITVRKQAKEMLRKSENMLRTVLDNFPGVVFWKDTQSNYLGCNRSFAIGAGLKSTAEVVGKTDLEMPWNSTEATNYMTDDINVMVHGKERRHIIEMQHLSDGRIIWLDTSQFPLLDSSGQVIGVIGVSNDISTLKMAEQELIIANKELAFQNDEKGKRAAELGIANKELALQNDEKEKRAAELVIANKELAFQNDEKEKREAELIIANKELLFQNHEKEKRAAELIIAKEGAEQSDRLKSAFLANMSHEIRTPMNGVLGFAGILKEADLSGEERLEYLELLEKSGARMLNIINDIVDISKIESGMMEVHLNESNINEQIDYIQTFFQPEMDKKRILFFCKKSLSTKEAVINTDSDKIYAILTNLVKNALKYTDEGSIEFGYNLKKEDQANVIEFFIKDTGIGIPKDRQEAIFERFIQANIVDKMARQGAGLGLSISKAFVELLGGKIWVSSEEKIGSAFYFTIPYKAGPETKNRIQKVIPLEDSENQINPEVSGLKILIAEDDASSELLLSITVRKLSKEVIKARTGNEAVEICRTNPDLDLILMDIQMPDLNGYEATRQIRQFNKNVIIIAQTAFGLSGDREKAIEAGCNDYIAKPIDKDELLSLIQKYFRK